MKIFAISGWKGSGKDTVADYLVKSHGFQRVSFADPLKDRVAEQFNIDRSSLDDPSRKEKPLLNMPVTPKDGFSKHVASFLFREFRDAEGEQAHGYFIDPTGNMYAEPFAADRPRQLYWTPRALAILEGSSKRTADSNHWVNQAVAKMNDKGLYVISDLRYTSELNALNTAAPNSVIPVRIERFETSPSTDPSERDLDAYPFPFRIDNKGSASLPYIFGQTVAILRQKGVLGEEASDSSEASQA